MVKRYEAQKRHAIYYERVARQCERAYLRGGAAVQEGLHRFDIEWLNIRLGQDWTKQHLDDLVVARLCSDYIDEIGHPMAEMTRTQLGKWIKVLDERHK